MAKRIKKDNKNIVFLKDSFKKFIDQQLENYKFIYITSDLRGFLNEYNILKVEKICKLIIDELLKKKLTILVPAYSYTSQGKFIVEKTKSNLSYFTKWCLNHKNSFRTYHPIFSFCVIGKNWREFEKISKSAYGKGSVWDILLKNKTSLLHFGRPFSLGNTSIHFVEFNSKAKYRFNKTFRTKVFRKKEYIGRNFSAYVQKKKFNGKKIEFDAKKISKLIEKKVFYKKIGSDKNFTNITHIDFKEGYDFMMKNFKKDNQIFIKEKNDT